MGELSRAMGSVSGKSVLDIMFPNFLEEVIRGTATPYMLCVMAEHKSWEKRYASASSEKTPPEVLARLAKDKIVYVRCAAAANEYTPPRVLVEALKDKEEIVRCAAVANLSTPLDVLCRTMVQDPSWRVRAAASYQMKSVQ